MLQTPHCHKHHHLKHDEEVSTMNEKEFGRKPKDIQIMIN